MTIWFITALKYIIIERSPALKTAQQKRLKSLIVGDLAWKTWSDIADNSIVGCFFSNELIDAFSRSGSE